MLLQEPTFFDRIGELEGNDHRPIGLYLTNIPGSDLLGAALERAGVPNEQDYKGLRVLQGRAAPSL
jgi:hypothetical protein